MRERVSVCRTDKRVAIHINRNAVLGIQVGEGRGGLVLEAGEQPALDRAELGRAVAEVGLEWGVQMTISLHLENITKDMI